MEAVYRWMISVCVVSAFLLAAEQDVSAANARSQNFLVHAPTQAMAEAVAKVAEDFRNELAEYWLGKRLQPWPTPCPIEVVSGPHLAAQGVTTYNRSPVSNFQMKVIGSPERIMDSVLPHEVTHTVLATHFGQPLPRWADEGICTTVEHAAERQKHEAKLREFLQTRRGIAMNQLFLLTEYPNDMLPMYAQGYSVCRFLIQQSGPKRFISFLTDYMQRPSWTSNVQKHYGYESLAQLQENWLAWVSAGSGPVEAYVSARTKASISLASNTQPQSVSGASGLGASGLGGRLAPATRQASAESSSGSWYIRRRLAPSAGAQTADAQTTGVQTATSQTATSQLGNMQPKPARRSIAPPSVSDSGHYSVSQPQAEQQYGQSARLNR